MAFEQATRSLNISTPLGDNAIFLTSLTAEEEMSRLFTFHLDMMSTDNSIQADDIVGKNITISLDYDDGEQRYFNGFVQRFSAGDEDVNGVRTYRAVVVPWLWFLTQTTDCRIFQEMTVLEIIEKIFDDLGFSDFDSSGVQGSHPTREYCVQYRESDYAFVSRLMEEEGIFYTFEHEDGKHTLLMADSAGAYTDCKESTVDYPRDRLASRGITPHIHGWEHNYTFRTGGWAHTDYNFKTPKTALMTTEKTLMTFQDVKKYEQYDYPGEYGVKSDGSSLARVRMEELELDHNLVTATSGCKSFTAGKRFTVGRHLCGSEEGKSFVIKKIKHEIREAAYQTRSGGGESDGCEYRNQFECFPDSATFRPARVTRKPIVEGPQTAVVVGPGGSEIYTDEFSRVKVQFFWDREGQKDDQSSCWVRVSQAWAGQNWGFVCIPRIGQEVIVGFLEGDPDQPIIIGRGLQRDQMPPYELPANMTQSGIKTRSTQGGSPTTSTRFVLKTRSAPRKCTSTPRKTKTSSSRTTAARSSAEIVASMLVGISQNMSIATRRFGLMAIMTRRFMAT
ncbi:MAG: type VI secretion system tip protein TssI/VgrG [Pirellulaceae bacterium]